MDVATGSLREQRPISAGVQRAAFSPRGTFLLLIEGNGQGAIWSAEQRMAMYWSNSLGEVRSLAMSEDERTLATGDEEGRVRIWDVSSGQLRGQYHWQPNAIVQLTFAPDHHTLAVATVEGQVHQIDVAARHVPDRLHCGCMSGQALAWSADGETLAAAAQDGSAYLFDCRTGAIKGILRCPVQQIRCLAFAPDGRTLAVVCQDEPFVRLWDTKDNRWRAVTASHPCPVTTAVFSADGRRLASLAGDTVRFWDSESATTCSSLAVASNTRALVFTSDGASLLTAGSILQVWDAASEESANRGPVQVVAAGAPATCLSVSRDGQLVASGGEDGSVRLWTRAKYGALMPDKATLLRPPGGGAVRSLAISADGKALLLGQGERLELWDLTAGRLRDTVDNSFALAAFSPGGSTFATVGNEGAVRLWEPETWRVTRPTGQSLEPVKSLAFSADGQTLITASLGSHRTVRHYKGQLKFDTSPWRSTSESLRTWDAITGQEQVGNLSCGDSVLPPHLVTCSPDHRLLAAGGVDGSIHILDSSGKQAQSRLFLSEKTLLYARGFELTRSLLWTNSSPDYDRHSEAVAALAFSPDGKRLAAAGNRGSFRLFAIEDGRVCCQWQGDAKGSSWLAFTNGGVIGSRGGQVCVWDAQTGALQAVLGAETDSPVLCGVLSPSMDVLALGSKNGRVRLWDLRNGEMKRLPGGHHDRVTCLGFSSDGKTLASAGWDHTVRLWNLATAREVAALEGHKGRINAVAFSPDGRLLASGGEIDAEHGEVLLWR